MAKLIENRICPYCDEYIMVTRDQDVHYSHTKRHTKQFFHYSCWKNENNKRVNDPERIARLQTIRIEHSRETYRKRREEND